MTDETLKLKIRYVPPETLKPYFRNTKIHTEEQLKDMVKVLDRFYFDQPIVVDANMVIIKGHGRYMASLRSQKKRLVPIIIRTDMTPEQVTAARISDNRLFDLGESIPELIKSEVVEFVAAGGKGAHDFFDFVAGTNLPDGVFAADSYEALTTPDAPAKKPKAIAPKEEEQPPVTPDQAAPKAEKQKPSKEVAVGVYCPNCNQLHEY